MRVRPLWNWPHDVRARRLFLKPNFVIVDSQDVDALRMIHSPKEKGSVPVDREDTPLEFEVNY
jgi:hypothetical protein